MKKKFFAVLALAVLLALSMAPAAWAAETAAGQTLYGVVVDSTSQESSWSGELSTIILFTQEGKEVKYNFAKDIVGKPAANQPQVWMGQPVAYRLNMNGEITDVKLFSSVLNASQEEIQVVNNTYLKSASSSKFYTLAQNAVIFEVGEDDHNVDVCLVNRSDLLTGGDFTPETLSNIAMGSIDGAPAFYDLDAYAKFELNADGAICALAYTTPSRVTLRYAVIEDCKIVDENHAGELDNGMYDYGIKLVGNEYIYDLDRMLPGIGNGRFVIYGLAGNAVIPFYVYKQNNGLTNFAKQLSSFNDGLLNFAEPIEPVMDDFNYNQDSLEVKTVPTDSNTVVYVIDEITGEYQKGSLQDIAKGSWAYVPVIDEDGFADCVLVDNYSHSTLERVPVTGVTLNKSELTLELKGSEQLTAAVEPANATNNTVAWTSSNENVATVDKDGKVMAVGVGAATITATVEKQKAECQVTVKATINEALDNVLDNPNASQAQVQETINALDKDELAAAIVADKELMAKIAQLENKLGGTTVNVAVEVAVKAADVIVVGAKVNDFKAELQIDKPENANIKVDVPENYTDFRFSMNLVNAETQAKVDVVVPMEMTLPIPVVEGTIFRADTFKLWHNHNGQNVEVAATVSQKDGKWFAKFMVNSFSDFIMTYQEIKLDEVYTITFDADGGTLATGVSNPDYVTKGGEYTMPAASKSGYTLKHWAIGAKDSATTAQANETYTFSADTTVYAVWDRNSTSGGSHSGGNRNPSGTSTPTKPEQPTKPTTPEKPGTTTNQPSGTVTALNINNVFADVKNGEWYSEAVAYVYNKGMMNGTEKGFEPNAATTRAMLVTMLHRLAGEPNTGNANFSDVADGQWFSKAIAWASANGVVTGYADGKFGPNDAITREQLAAVLYRFAQAKGMDVSAKSGLSNFSDSGKVSGWAQEAMQWAVGAGIINGDSGALKPQGNATRAEVAMMIMRFNEM